MSILGLDYLAAMQELFSFLGIGTKHIQLLEQCRVQDLYENAYLYENIFASILRIFVKNVRTQKELAANVHYLDS